ncbi:3-deoxy-manno-octulosonate cytidylyltransferase [Flaviaesturariibacter aridisoli]|uniref:3-deoxy-manno-octulosonate cytidylyltransferase n=1 Tax=Flaviaesturariibacter aridisoli TaxID=2545761 RepID=A0A4R4DYE9_9BACT|nr:3-deoxy-manno-octulosonate cytidylyltransferase [Flaviaesturariibacter aridisoli]TCZ70478.1 3-deoxy-manno-octulosonate cytidylyltransferase [Flaviaesturariibacter aridisoli]
MSELSAPLGGQGTVIAVLPARYAATRFPGKLLQLLGDKTVIRRTYEAAQASGLFDEVLVATDSPEIRAEVEGFGGQVAMTRADHESGTDRIAEAVADRDVDIVVNVQGDTPFINTKALRQLIDLFEDESVHVASLMDRITDPADLANPNVVKVCTDLRGNSLFFSRSPVPFPRAQDIDIPHYRHIGVYAFRKAALLQFTQWPMTPLEAAEKIECLRFLEHGVPLRMALTEPIGVDINTPEDLEKAKSQL